MPAWRREVPVPAALSGSQERTRRGAALPTCIGSDACSFPGWALAACLSLLPPALAAQLPTRLPAACWDELEQIRPSVYRNVARQLHISLQSEPVVTDAFLAVAGHIFSAGITWGKVVSLYSVAAGLAVDCVRQAQPAMVHALVDCLGEFVRKTLATWLRRRGGWTDVLKCVVSTDPSLHSHWLVAALCNFGRFLKAAFFVLLPER
nr:bcl-2-related ovarian killer protein [Cavia porcellus]